MTAPVIFDHRRLVARRYRLRANAFLLEQLGLRALDRLAALTTPPAHIAVLGFMPDSFATALRDLFPQATVEAARLENEILHVTQTPDAVVDLGQLALVNDVPGLLIQIKRALKPEGLFIGTLFGGESLTLLRGALLQAETALTGGVAPRLHPMLALEDSIALLQRTGFAQPVADREPLTVHYSHLTSLARDLRAAGLSNALSAAAHKMPPRQLFAQADAIWRTLSALPTGQRLASFEILSLTGWTTGV